MTEQEARTILHAYRPGLEEELPEVAQALQMAARDPELAEWFAEEQAFDRAMTAHLEAVPPPFGLKTRILAHGAPVERRQWSWATKLAAVAALLFLLAQIVSLFHTPRSPAAKVADYASEMVSFIKINPPLEMGSDNLGEIKKYLASKEMTPLNIPPRLASLEPLGCRVLSFRGHKVTLVCFQRDENGLAHLFVVDRSTMPGMKPGDKPVFGQEGEWATASWVEKGSVYMVAAKGGPETVRRFLPRPDDQANG